MAKFLNNTLNERDEKWKIVLKQTLNERDEIWEKRLKEINDQKKCICCNRNE